VIDLPNKLFDKLFDTWTLEEIEACGADESIQVVAGSRRSGLSRAQVGPESGQHGGAVLWFPTDCLRSAVRAAPDRLCE
jgi:hypothetical protein